MSCRAILSFSPCRCLQHTHCPSISPLPLSDSTKLPVYVPNLIATFLSPPSQHVCNAEVLKLRHEYAQHPEGWVARKKRSNAVKEPLQRWGVTDSGATCSRVGPNYQVTTGKFARYKKREEKGGAERSRETARAGESDLGVHVHKHVGECARERTWWVTGCDVTGGGA